MADTKISAMTAATVVGNADLLPVVQGGANVKATKTEILTGKTGEAHQFLPGGSDILSFGDHTSINRVFFTYSTGALEIQATGSVDMRSLGQVTIYAGTGLSVTVGYVPANPADWSASPPADVASALDDIQACLTSILGAGNIVTGAVLPFVASNPSVWLTSAPTFLYDAVNRLAQQVYVLSGSTPIP